MNDFLKELHDIGMFFQMLFLVGLYTGLALVPAVLIVRGLFQAILMRNVAGRGWK